MKRVIRKIGAAIAAAALTVPAYSTTTQYGTGLSSVNQPVSFRADLTISDNILTLVLQNLSLQSTAPNDLLSSYYFDIFNGTTRPTLTLLSETGDVYRASRTSTDTLQQQNANLLTYVSGDQWQYKLMNAALNPNMGFGVGTVGNNNLNPNGFNGNLVDGSALSIYAGDVTTQNLDNLLLVKGPITFTFTGVSGYTEADIKSTGMFGLGTAPDSLLPATVPEPTAILAVSLLLGLKGLRRRSA